GRAGSGRVLEPARRPAGCAARGAMGSGIARRLAGAGHDLVVWNRARSKAEPLAIAGAFVAESPADVARRVEAVITMVANPQALADVTEGEQGVAAGLGGGTTVIPMSTVSPDPTAPPSPLLPRPH